MSEYPNALSHVYRYPVHCSRSLCAKKSDRSFLNSHNHNVTHDNVIALADRSKSRWAKKHV